MTTDTDLKAMASLLHELTAGSMDVVPWYGNRPGARYCRQCGRVSLDGGGEVFHEHDCAVKVAQQYIEKHT